MSSNPKDLLISGLAVSAILFNSAVIPAGSAPIRKGAPRASSGAKGAVRAGTRGKAGDVQDANAQFNTLVDAYFEECFKVSPTWATELGIHQYDSMLEDYSSDAFQREASMHRAYKVQFKALDFSKLNRQNRLDRDIIMAHIDDQLFDIEVLQKWKKNPDMYSSGVTSSIFSLIKRNFAPIEQRMQSIISREERIPAALEAAKKNLMSERVPPVYAEINLEQLPGAIDFFTTAVPDALRTVVDPTLRQSFAQSNLAAIDALKDYQKFVTEMVAQKRCKGTFALGEENYARKLEYEQMIDTPVDKLLADGMTELRSQQKQFTELAQKLSPNQNVDEYFKTISKDHPKGDKVIESVSSLLDELRTFCTDKNIVTVPSPDAPKVEETPSFERALSFASMDTPGPFEVKAKEAYYFVTLPEPTWTAQHAEEHLRSFSYPDLINTSVHEAYPGHYEQFLWSKQFPSKTRKIISVSSNYEGWAHYCEQMMLDQGLKDNDQKLRLVQLHDALLRNCRYIVAIQMHAKNMTLDQAIDFFMKEGYMERANAEREAKRGTMDPTYLVYTYGKMQILAMRDEYKKLKGSAYSLKDFHDRFLKCGAVPLKIVRTELLAAKQSDPTGNSAMAH